MTPKNKAKDLLHNYDVQVRFSMEDCSFTYRDSDYSLAIKRTAKQCALIAVNEILKSKPNEVYKIYSTWIPASTYWKSVKHEIQKL
jgi:hypothetical protein